jgi:transposase
MKLRKPQNSQADRQLVAAVTRINRIVRGTVDRGFVEVGDYVLRTFFQDDPALVGSRNSKKALSFRALAERCGREITISRTWLNNAVRAAIIRRGLPKRSAFSRLASSHQAVLLPLREPAAVEELAERVEREKLSVEVTRANVREALGRPGKRKRLKSSIVRTLRQMQIWLDVGTKGRPTFLKSEFASLSKSERTWTRAMANALANRLRTIALRIGPRTLERG